MISKGFLKSSFIYSFVGALPLASSFILLPFYSNVHLLSKSDFGMLMMYIVFTMLFQVIMNFGMESFIAVSFSSNKNNPEKQKELISSSVALLLIIGIVLSIVFLICGNSIFTAINSMYTGKTGQFEFFPWGFFCVLTAFCNSFFKSYTGLLVNQQRPLRFFWCNITNFMLTIGISLITIYMFPMSLTGPMYGRLLSGLVIFIMALVFFSREFGLGLHKKHLKQIWLFSYPVFLYLLILWLVSSVDRYILYYYLDSVDVGIFSFAISCTMMVEFVQNGLSSAIFPKVYSLWNLTNERKSTPDVNKYFNGLALVSVMILPAFLILIPYIIILFISNTGMYETFYIFPILTIGFVTRALQAMFMGPLYYYERTKSLPRVYFVSAIFQIVLDILLIKYFGLLGAAITIVIVKIIQTVLLYFESKRIFTFRFNVVKQIILPLIYLVLIVLMYPFTFEKLGILSDIGWNRLLINSVQLVLITAISYAIFKKDIDEGVRKYWGQLTQFKVKTIFRSDG